MRARRVSILLFLLSGVAFAAELPRCTRVLPEPSFARELGTYRLGESSLGVKPDSGEIPVDALSHGAPFEILAVHEMDLTGTGVTVAVTVEGLVFRFFDTMYFPRVLRRVDPATGETLWSQDLPGGLFGLGFVSDLDEDGRDDLLFDQFQRFFIFFSPAGFHFFWGDGDGPLTPGQRTRSLPRLDGLLDVDGDGRKDALVSIGPHRTLYPGTSPRTFDERIAYTTIVEGVLVDEPGRQISSGDLDEDGLDDLVAFTQYEFSHSVGIARGDGTFDVRPLPRPGTKPFGGTLHDLDADGHLDLVAAEEWPREALSVAWGRGDGTFEPWTSFPAGERFGDYALGDVTGDGQSDLVVVYEDSPDPLNLSRLAAFPMKGREMGAAVPFEIPGVDFYLGPPVLADVDGDGLDDLVVVVAPYPGPFRLAWRRALGDGSFGPIREILDAPFAHRVERIVPTDFDLDGITDLFVQTADTGPFGTPNRSLRGDGTGSFEVVFSGRSMEPYHYDLFEDVDADGRPDLLSRLEYEAYEGHLTYPVLVRRGDGLGGFGPPMPTSWIAFAGPTGRFRTAGTRDMVRIGWFGERAEGSFILGKGLFQLEVLPSTGFVLEEDAAPPVVEIRVLPVPGSSDPDLRRVATLPIDECSSAPRVTERFVDLLPLGEGIPFSYRRGETEEVWVFELPGSERRGVVLVGPDRSSIRDAFFAAKDRGGFPFHHMAPMRIVSTGAYGDPLPGFPAARLVQRFVLEGGFVAEVEVTRPGTEVGLTARAEDGVSR